jgi:threonine dehydratase
MEGVEGRFVHPVADDDVMAGNGTIGLEIAEDLPNPDAVLIPFGGGGLTVGIASALRAFAPQARVYPVEPETAAPLAASLAAGSPQEVDYRASFVDGAGARTVLPEMWPLVREVVDGSLTVSLDEAAGAIRLLAERARVIAEGAGALGVAAALSGRAGDGRIVCVVSGGNIDFSTLVTILQGQTP